MMPDTAERVTVRTAGSAQARIDAAAEERVIAAAERLEQLNGRLHDIDRRLRELDREWDIERTLQANAASLTLLGTVLGAFVDRRFLALPALVGGFLLQHAVQGWCPPLPLRRRGGNERAHQRKEEARQGLLRHDVTSDTGCRSVDADRLQVVLPDGGPGQIQGLGGAELGAVAGVDGPEFLALVVTRDLGICDVLGAQGSQFGRADDGAVDDVVVALDLVGHDCPSFRCRSGAGWACAPRQATISF